MNKIFFFFAVFVSSFSFAAVPSFIEVGTVYGFVFAGRAANAESSLAKVEKIDPTGWVEISPLPKGDRIWINLAQVQVVSIAKANAAQISEALIRRKVYENLLKIASRLDQATILEGQKPKTVAELFGTTSGYIPFEIVDGEDYSKLDLMDGQLAIITIKTKSGYVISFDRKK